MGQGSSDGLQPDPQQSKPEEPKLEEPKLEEPKPDEPKPEEPKPEEPKPEEPKPEEPKPEVMRPELTAIFEKVVLQQRQRAADVGVPEQLELQTYIEIFRESEKQRHQHREILTPALRNIATMWVIAVLFFIFWQGFGYKIGIFHLTDTVLITLLTTTTANVLGLFYIAVRYLYANPDFKSPRMRRQEENGGAYWIPSAAQSSSPNATSAQAQGSVAPPSPGATER